MSDEKLIRKCVKKTAQMIDGAWKGRVDQEDLNCLVRVLAGRGTKEDIETLKRFGVKV